MGAPWGVSAGAFLLTTTTSCIVNVTSYFTGVSEAQEEELFDSGLIQTGAGESSEDKT